MKKAIKYRAFTTKYVNRLENKNTKIWYNELKRRYTDRGSKNYTSYIKRSMIIMKNDEKTMSSQLKNHNKIFEKSISKWKKRIENK